METEDRLGSFSDAVGVFTLGGIAEPRSGMTKTAPTADSFVLPVYVRIV